MAVTGYVLSLDGVPWCFGSAGVASLPTSGDANWSSQWTLVQHALDVPSSRLSWEERISPVSGDLDVAGLEFVLNDVAGVAGVTAGQGLVSYLTRDAASLTKTTITATVAAGATSLDVTDASVFGAAPFDLWIESEALRCGSVAGNTLTVTRARYGSRAVAHTYDAARLVTPEAWAATPWLHRRRAILWVVDAGAATAVWIGYVTRAPRLRDDTGRLALTAESAWTVHRAARLGFASATTQLRGYNHRCAQLVASYATIGRLGEAWRRPVTRVSGTLADLAREVAARLQEDSANATPGSVLRVRGAAAGRNVTFTGQLSGAGSAFWLDAQIGTRRAGPVWSASTADPRLAAVTLVDCPPVAVWFRPGNTAAHTPLTTVTDFPSSWSGSDADGSHTTTRRAALEAALGDRGARFVIRPTAHSDSDAYFAPGQGPAVTGPADVEGVSLGEPSAIEDLEGAVEPFDAHSLCVVRALWLRRITEVRADHWAYGVRRALTDTSVVGSPIDDRDFDWSTVAAVADATGSEYAARVWRVAGQTAEEWLRPTFALAGCALAPRGGGKLALVRVAQPTASDAAALTLGKTDLPIGHEPTSEPGEEGIVNLLRIKRGEDTVTLRDARSAQRYGDSAKAIEVDLDGVANAERILSTPAEWAAQLFSRTLGLWADPVPVVSAPATLDKIASAYVGDTIALTESALPDGTGARGLSGAKLVCLARRIDLNAGVIRFEGPRFRVAVGYSPCARVSSIVGAVLTLADGYVLAGSGDATNYAGEATSFGAARFQVGDRVELVQRNSTSPRAPDSFVIQSISTNTITLTASPDAAWQAVITGGGIVDVRFDDYTTAGVQSAQKSDWAWVGGDTVIAGTATATQRWAA